MDMLVNVERGVESAVVLVIGEVEIAGQAGVTLLQSSDGLIDLGDLDELTNDAATSASL